jgi:hypothetical protein
MVNEASSLSRVPHGESRSAKSRKPTPGLLECIVMEHSIRFAALVPSLDLRPAAVHRNPTTGGTSARRAGMGAAGLPYTCPGSTTGGFSSAECEFRHTDRGISGPIGYWQRGGAGQRQL